MGGRGSSSYSGSKALEFPKNEFIRPEYQEELKGLSNLQERASSLGVTIDDQVLLLYNQKALEYAMDGIARVKEMFPNLDFSELGKYGLFVTSGSENDPGYAEINVANELVLNPKFYSQKNGIAVADIMLSDAEERHFSVKNSSFAYITSHEIGHIIEAILIKRMYPGNSPEDYIKRANAWDGCINSTIIMNLACNKLKAKNSGYQGVMNKKIMGQVSEYSSKSMSEALAECVMDYAANGENAHPLSLEVYDILRNTYKF